MKTAVVGSRRWLDRTAVVEAVAALPVGTVVVSGGCAGPDTWAAEAARAQGLQVLEYLPDLPAAGAPRWAFTRAYHARNQRVVDAADNFIAFVAADRRGGTEDTIRRALRAGKQVDIRCAAESQSRPTSGSSPATRASVP